MKTIKKLGLLFLSLTVSSAVAAKDKFEYFFDETIQFDSSIHKPSDTLGYAIADWHIRPDQSLAFFKALDKSSDKVKVTQTGLSHEQRPLIAAFISSPENLAKLGTISADRKNLNFQNTPNVVYLGYSVHGNEASGANAAPLVAYRLAASQERWVQELLANNIVIIDPMLNPDGLDRFANWVNRYKGAQLVSDSDSIEHNEAWPAGRTNHYWFDLNRDWLLLQHPESRARVELFYNWRPTIVGDFHEMGTNSTYFFQPGVPSRQNPLTSDLNFELTNEIAKYHAKALDKLSVPYYSKESFDDFYYGKGSTFPDINGGIGILFEQASSRGHTQESINGEVTFPFAVRNQVATSFSTLKAAKELGSNLKDYQADFFKEQRIKAVKDTEQGVIFTSKDNGRLQEFLSILKQHQIEVSQLKNETTVEGKNYPAKDSYLVKYNQEQYGLIKTIFESRTEFEDNTFYDVSAWTMPHAFNLHYQILDSRKTASLFTEKVELKLGQLTDAENVVAYSYSANNLYSLAFTNKLLAAGLTVRLSRKSFELPVSAGNKTFSKGSLVVQVDNAEDKAILKNLWQSYAQARGMDLTGINTGFSQSGIDLGSPNMVNLKAPKPLLLIGNGVSSYEAGEAWFLLDKRLEIQTSMQPASDLANIDLSEYSHLIMVNGRYPKLDDAAKKKIEQWLNQGGALVASRSAVRWVIEHKLAPLELVKRDAKAPEGRPYSERQAAFTEQLIGGAIFETQLDLSHPLTFGIQKKSLPYTKASSQIIQPAKRDFITVAEYSDKPLLAGYASKENVDAIKNTAAVVALRKGRGSVIVFNDNPNFRGYWLGSARLFANTLFFSGAF
ncbi:M14 family metallopeptidase [Kangiella sp. HZ709]|uniref:M14 family metallopeptidase n=1 Tax=Kangiella sp. HZ709 TaxID=2666328 RepID=UPI0012AF7720|nr:M14 family metallopeptidase [Kangiella sp. HZ709]